MSTIESLLNQELEQESSKCEEELKKPLNTEDLLLQPFQNHNCCAKIQNKSKFTPTQQFKEKVALKYLKLKKFQEILQPRINQIKTQAKSPQNNEKITNILSEKLNDNFQNIRLQIKQHQKEEISKLPSILFYIYPQSIHYHNLCRWEKYLAKKVKMLQTICLNKKYANGLRLARMADSLAKNVADEVDELKDDLKKQSSFEKIVFEVSIQYNSGANLEEYGKTVESKIKEVIYKVFANSIQK